MLTKGVVIDVVRQISSKRPISPQYLFNLDTKALYGPQRTVRSERCSKPSEFDLVSRPSAKERFDKDTELLLANAEPLHRARSVPKGIPISQKSKYLRELFRIPRGQPASLFPQAYIPNRYLDVSEKKRK